MVVAAITEGPAQAVALLKGNVAALMLCSAAISAGARSSDD